MSDQKIPVFCTHSKKSGKTDREVCVGGGINPDRRISGFFYDCPDQSWFNVKVYD